MANMTKNTAHFTYHANYNNPKLWISEHICAQDYSVRMEGLFNVGWPRCY